MNLNAEQKQLIIDMIKENKKLPDNLQEVLFDKEVSEYELKYAGKMRKEDLLANQDGTFPLPLQTDRIFNGERYEGFEDNWKNLLVFGDNLQFLKTIYENKDPLIKDKVKGKVKLIYIDPPFATSDEFTDRLGTKAYNDKKKGAEFIEFIRRRLILAREILADDGYIAVHLDQKMNSYIRVILDEVFGKNNMINELIWRYFMGGKSVNFFSKKHDTIYVYKKTTKPDMIIPDRERVLESKPSLSSTNNTMREYEGVETRTGEKRMFYTSTVKQDDVLEISGVFNLSKEYTPYPTQKPEELISVLINAMTKENDIVLDFFGGSGTTMVTAEKLNRRWITCDLGKLSYFTMQKRLLQISQTNSLINPGKDYNKNPKSFVTAKLGMYDLQKTLEMDMEKYKEFVSQLFEFDREENYINGMQFDGRKKRYPVKVFDYKKYQDVSIDETYLKNMINALGTSAPKEIYIVSPATKVNFIADYEEIGDTRFYFLKVPYEMIRELHEISFVNFIQPRNKGDVNEIEEMKGFQFVNKPEIECELISKDNIVTFKITKFKSYSIKQGIIDDFSTLSSIYVDFDNNNDVFVMDDVRFWNEIASKRKADSDTEVVYNKNEKISFIKWEFPKDKIGSAPVFIVSDIFGNDIVVKPIRREILL